MKITDIQLDTLTEIINIGVGLSASVLNEMVESHVTLQVPKVQILDQEYLIKSLEGYGDESLSSVLMTFDGLLTGTSSLIFPPESAANLVSLLTGEDINSPELDSLKTGTLNEVGNIVLNGIMGSIANTLETHLTFAIPIYVEDTVTNLVKSRSYNNGAVIMAEAVFKVEKYKIEGNILLFFKVESFESLLATLDSVHK